jgi:hypothetical protein
VIRRNNNENRNNTIFLECDQFLQEYVGADNKFRVILDHFSRSKPLKDILANLENIDLCELLKLGIESSKDPRAIDLVDQLLDHIGKIPISNSKLEDPFYLSLISYDVRASEKAKDIYKKILDRYSEKRLVDQAYSLSFYDIVLHYNFKDDLKKHILEILFSNTSFKDIHNSWKKLPLDDPYRSNIGMKLYDSILSRLTSIYTKEHNLYETNSENPFNKQDFTDLLKIALDADLKLYHPAQRV